MLMHSAIIWINVVIQSAGFSDGFLVAFWRQRSSIAFDYLPTIYSLSYLLYVLFTVCRMIRKF